MNQLSLVDLYEMREKVMEESWGGDDIVQLTVHPEIYADLLRSFCMEPHYLLSPAHMRGEGGDLMIIGMRVFANQWMLKEKAVCRTRNGYTHIIDIDISNAAQSIRKFREELRALPKIR